MNLPYVIYIYIYISLSLSLHSHYHYPLPQPPITSPTYYWPLKHFFRNNPTPGNESPCFSEMAGMYFVRLTWRCCTQTWPHSSLQWNLVMAIQLSEVEISCFSMLNSHTKWQSGIHKQSPACICTHTPPASSKALTSMANISSHMLTTEGGTPLAFDRMFAAKHANGHARINFSPRIWNFATGASRSVSACVLQLGLL